MKFAWHGSASFSFRSGGLEFLVDPHFSRKEDYGDWYIPNLGAPDFESYFRYHNPDYLIITHGHFDHFDLHTVEKIIRAKNPSFIGSHEVTDALIYYFNVPREKLFPIEENNPVKLGNVNIKAYEGVHWLTGEEGTRASEKLRGRPDRYGVMPCGGPMLQFILDGPEEKIYISGDTMLEGVPEVDVDIAVFYTGGPAPHPVTKEPTKAIIDFADIVTIVEERLKPKVIIPVHYDFQYMEPVDLCKLNKMLAGKEQRPRMFVPPYNIWHEVKL